MLEDQFLIRDFRPTDADDLVKILKTNIPQYFHEDEVKDYITYLRSEAFYYKVVVNGKGEMVGGGGINELEVEIRLSWLFISSAIHSRGLGSLLINNLLRSALELGRHSKPIVTRTSQLAFQFFEKFGFEIESVVNDYWAEGFDLVRMVYCPK